MPTYLASRVPKLYLCTTKVSAFKERWDLTIWTWELRVPPQSLSWDGINSLPEHLCTYFMHSAIHKDQTNTSLVIERFWVCWEREIYQELSSYMVITTITEMQSSALARTQCPLLPRAQANPRLSAVCVTCRRINGFWKEDPWTKH